ncbi:hypothetical protein QJQ45_010481 [Haematococcus lacustris]|nr:hypothetical protein QJQ45_010481 [Haematococcus lacustris]
MWCPVVAPRKPPQAPGSSQAASQAAASEPGPSTPLPAKRSKRTKAEPEAAEPTKGKGKAAKAKPAPQPGRWLDRDCNAALNMQRIGESKWRPLELCFWPDQGALPAKGKEYPGLGYKRLLGGGGSQRVPAAVGAHKQLVVFFGNAGIGTRGGWGAKAVQQACHKVVERPNSGKPNGRVPGKLVTVDEFRTTRVSSTMNSPQPCEEELDSSKPTTPEDWKPKPGQVQNRLLRSPWSKRFEAPVRGLMWCPWVAQATPGDLGKWVDRDCNAALNLQRAGEAKWRPLELRRWPHRGRLPAKGQGVPSIGLQEARPSPKAQAQQPVAQ